MKGVDATARTNELVEQKKEEAFGTWIKFERRQTGAACLSFVKMPCPSMEKTLGVDYIFPRKRCPTALGV